MGGIETFNDKYKLKPVRPTELVMQSSTWTMRNLIEAQARVSVGRAGELSQHR